MPGMIGLDFETYSATSLKKHGMRRYMADPHFQPLIGGLVLKVNGSYVRHAVDFIDNPKTARREVQNLIGDKHIVAHNAPFEQAVLEHLRLPYPSRRFVDSVVVARVAGAAAALEGAAPQLLGSNKLASGQQLIKLFTMPGEFQAQHLGPAAGCFDPLIIDKHPTEWKDFTDYCLEDAYLGLRIAEDYLPVLSRFEHVYSAITMDMNNYGWCVDLDLVTEMQRRYLENQEAALAEFRTVHNEPDLNLNSYPQQKKWCADRGIKVSSFDKAHVESLHRRLRKKLDTMSTSDAKYKDYEAVLDLMRTKQVLGGSSLKKLQTILDTVVPDSANPGQYCLKDQYFHCGAAQTLRTSGRSVQLQNLKTFDGEPDDVDELFDMSNEWDNEKLGSNLRQVFTASHPQGLLIVGDFSSVEAVGLAWQAGQQSTLDAFRNKKDIYATQASLMFGKPYEQISKESDERRAGKVGMLSCGYQAGAGAVQQFAAKMGIVLSEGEATRLVYDWRDANPEVVRYWDTLDAMLHSVVEDGMINASTPLPDDCYLNVERVPTPKSLLDQHGTAQSIRVSVTHVNEGILFSRFFHGCHMRGRNVNYYKPSKQKTGELWKNWYIDSKTKQRRNYELYGGKLAGILTQSLCREIFFHVLRRVHLWCDQGKTVQLVGQFHDEIVLDWKPGAISAGFTKSILARYMSEPGVFKSFPLRADVKSDYRYTK